MAAKISIIIPAYNESTRIAHTIDEVSEFVDEIIVIDDASSDSTAIIANEKGAIVKKNSVNKGYIASIKKGFKMATGDIIITFDADGEFPANKIDDLIRPIKNKEVDMVQGARNIVPRPSEKLLTWVAGLIGPVGDSGTGFRALTKQMAKNIELKGACICGVFSLEVLSMGGKIAEIPISLRTIDKPRKIAWYHVKQLFYVLSWFLKFNKNSSNK